MAAFKVTTDHAALARKLQNSVKRYPRAAAAGINKTGDAAYTFSVREIQNDVGASAQKTIRRNLKFDGATGEKPQGRLTARSSREDRIPIFEMKPKPRTVYKAATVTASGKRRKRKPRPPGVSYGPQNKMIPGSFIAKMKSGKIGVFKRTGIFGQNNKEQIVQLYGPSVALVFSRKTMTDKVQAFIRQKLPIEMARAFKFVTG